MGTKDEPVAGDIGSVPCCARCNGTRVVRVALACWNPDTGLWELETLLDQARCVDCEAPTDLSWSRPDHSANGRIRALNDAFRTRLDGAGTVVITTGLQARGDAVVAQALAAVQRFDGFTPENDPWGEHDFGAIHVNGDRIFWKIDYYDPTLTVGSDNPANAALTHRVLTIMLAEEY